MKRLFTFLYYIAVVVFGLLATITGIIFVGIAYIIAFPFAFIKPRKNIAHENKKVNSRFSWHTMVDLPGCTN